MRLRLRGGVGLEMRERKDAMLSLNARSTRENGAIDTLGEASGRRERAYERTGAGREWEVLDG